MLGNSASNFNVLIKNTLDRLKPTSILELGCGEGKLSTLVKEINLDTKLVAVQKLFTDTDEALLTQRGYSKIIDTDILEYFKTGFDEEYDLIVIMDVIEHFLYSDAFSIIDFALYRSKWLLLIWPSKHPQYGINNQFDRHRSSFEINSLTNNFDVVMYEQTGFAQMHFLHRYHFCVIRGNMNTENFK